MAANLNELIFIKRVKKHPHEGSHGGAWKIAYADFVTAMMAFFLLLWLLSSTSQEQRSAISNYFAPQSASKTTSGAGGMLGGRVLDSEGALTASMASPRIVLGVPQVEPGTEVEVENPNDGAEANSGPLPKNDLENVTGQSMGTVPAHDLKARNEAALGTVAANAAKDAHDLALGPVAENDAEDAKDLALARAKETTGTDPEPGQGGSLGNHDRESQGLLPDGGGPGTVEKGAEDRQLAEIERKLKERIAGDEVLRNYRANVTVERAAEGLRIQIIDDDKREMFPLGSAELMDHTSKLFKTVADLIKDQPNRIAISGHTDSTPYRGSGGYSNWELSTDRANASRRALMASGVPEGRIARVVGKADTEPMDPTKPEGAINRRISVVLLREGRPRAASAARSAAPTTPTMPTAPASLPMPRLDAAASGNAAGPTLAPTTATPPAFEAPKVPGPPSPTQATTPASLPVPEAKAAIPAPLVPAPPTQTAPAPAAVAAPEVPAESEPGQLDEDADLQDNWLRLR